MRGPKVLDSDASAAHKVLRPTNEISQTPRILKPEEGAAQQHANACVPFSSAKSALNHSLHETLKPHPGPSHSSGDSEA